jgi:hypothetical protein
LLDWLQTRVQLGDLIRHRLYGRLDFTEFALLSLFGLEQRRRLVGRDGWCFSRVGCYLFLFRLRACQLGLPAKGCRVGEQGKKIEAGEPGQQNPKTGEQGPHPVS